MTTQKRFKSMPSMRELAAMDRDLTFHPSTVADPAALTRTQIDAYNHEGYIKGIPIFDTAEIIAQRNFFDEILPQVLSAGGSSYSIYSAHLKYGMVYDTLTHPRIVACVQDILGPDVVGWAGHYFCKLPGEDKIVDWHQDASYWPLSPSKTVTVWLAIDDADTRNGCMRFVAGSHHHGHLTYRLSEAADKNVLSQTVEDAEQFGEIVDIELKAGAISLHSDLLLHSSNINLSSRRRCGLTLRYCTPDVRAIPGFGWGEEGVVISGEDPTRHWSTPPRPARDFVVDSENLTEMIGLGSRAR